MPRAASSRTPTEARNALARAKAAGFDITVVTNTKTSVRQIKQLLGILGDPRGEDQWQQYNRNSKRVYDSNMHQIDVNHTWLELPYELRWELILSVFVQYPAEWRERHSENLLFNVCNTRLFRLHHLSRLKARSAATKGRAARSRQQEDDMVELERLEREEEEWVGVPSPTASSSSASSSPRTVFSSASGSSSYRAAPSSSSTSPEISYIDRTRAQAPQVSYAQRPQQQYQQHHYQHPYPYPNAPGWVMVNRAPETAPNGRVRRSLLPYDPVRQG